MSVVRQEWLHSCHESVSSMRKPVLLTQQTCVADHNIPGSTIISTALHMTCVCKGGCVRPGHDDAQQNLLQLS
jgi:hypothetical protein